MAANNFHESDERFDFGAVADTFKNKFMLSSHVSGEEKETLADRFYTDRTVVIKIAIDYPEQNQRVEYDAFQSRIDAIIGDLPNPTNFQSDGIRNVTYSGHELTQEESYIVCDISFTVEDSITYG